ncbi:MAG: hypothetical protein Q9183_000533 [Haloplaca sp. 2 TL-2023]
MSKAGLWIKMSAAFLILSVGGPATLYYFQPTDEEVFKRYNPELQKRSLANRKEREQEFDAFVNKLKGYSKSSKPSTDPTGNFYVWEVAAEDEAQTRAKAIEQQQKAAADIQKRREEIKRQSISGQ